MTGRQISASGKLEPIHLWRHRQAHSHRGLIAGLPPLLDAGFATLVILAIALFWVWVEIVTWLWKLPRRIDREQAARAAALLREAERHTEP